MESKMAKSRHSHSKRERNVDKSCRSTSRTPKRTKKYSISQQQQSPMVVGEDPLTQQQYPPTVENEAESGWPGGVHNDIAVNEEQAKQIQAQIHQLAFERHRLVSNLQQALQGSGETPNEPLAIGNRTERKLGPALADHLEVLLKHGFDKELLKLLKAVATNDHSGEFHRIVEKVHSAVCARAGSDMPLSDFCELVAGCRAEAPAVQQLIATLDYDQREELESFLAIGEMQHFGTAFPAVCRDWLFVALVWDGRQQQPEEEHTAKSTHTLQHSNDTPSTQHGRETQRRPGQGPLYYTTESTQSQQHPSSTLRFHAAAVALQILRDVDYCLPLRPGSVTHMTHTITTSGNAMLGQASYVDDFSKKLVGSFIPRAYDKIPFFTNFSTPRAGKTTVLMNGLRTAPL
eukprot:PhM_4_TR13289/c0_g1_i2/m.36241